MADDIAPTYTAAQGGRTRTLDAAEAAALRPTGVGLPPPTAAPINPALTTTITPGLADQMAARQAARKAAEAKAAAMGAGMPAPQPSIWSRLFGGG